MISYNIYDINSFEDANVTRDDVINFLYVHLDEYGDDRKDIHKCLDYALSDQPGRGGFIVLAQNEQNEIVGAVIINFTGMSGYIPENILVYIAVNKEYRGQGIGKKLMEHTIDHANGDIALHVEPQNPAKFLYEKYGFTNKYLEMRFHK